MGLPSWFPSLTVGSRDSTRAVFSIKTLTARFLPNTAIDPCRRMVVSLSTSSSVVEFASVTQTKSTCCQGGRRSILMLPNRGLGFKGTEGLLMNSYLMPLWVLLLRQPCNPNRHWVNWQSLLDFLLNGQEEKGTRLDSRGRGAAVPAMGQTRRTSWRLGQIRGQGTGCSGERQAWRASTEEVEAQEKAAVVAHSAKRGGATGAIPSCGRSATAICICPVNPHEPLLTAFDVSIGRRNIAPFAVCESPPTEARQGAGRNE
jgi:hypothetical protein